MSNNSKVDMNQFKFEIGQVVFITESHTKNISIVCSKCNGVYSHGIYRCTACIDGKERRFIEVWVVSEPITVTGILINTVEGGYVYLLDAYVTEELFSEEELHETQRSAKKEADSLNGANPEYVKYKKQLK